MAHASIEKTCRMPITGENNNVFACDNNIVIWTCKRDYSRAFCASHVREHAVKCVPCRDAVLLAILSK